MKKLLLFASALCVSALGSFAQVSYNVDGPKAGGTGEFPDGPTSTTSTTGWTEIHSYNTLGTDNTWSIAVEIGFPFDFYGNAVTHFIVSKNFLLSFDTTLTGQTVNANIADNGSLPDANLPNNTIAYFWDNFADGTGSLGTNDDVWVAVYGTAPNRQLWVKNYSYETGGNSYSYNHLILEETTNNIYFYDSYNATNAAGSRTIGVQLDASTAVQTSGSPNEQSTNTSSSFSTSSYWEFNPVQLVANQIGLAEITAPTNPLSTGMQNVTATYVNAGTNDVTSAQIYASIDDGSSVTTIGPVSTTDTVHPGDTSAVATIGSFNFSAGTYTITAWTEMPNSVVDTINDNDTMMVTVCTPLSGAYTINSGAATGGTNFASFAAFADALATCGISAAVTADVVASSGPYTEQVIFEEISGSSMTNTITINGNGERLEYATGSPNYAVVALNGTDYMTIDNLEIAGTSGTQCMGVLLTAQANNNTISNCTIDLSALMGSTSSTIAGIAASGSFTSATSTGDNANDLSISNNTIIGGYYGIRINGESGTISTGNRIMGNTLEDFYSYGIYPYYQDGVVVSDNDLSRPTRSSVTTFYGIYYSGAGSQNSLTNRNRIHNTHGAASSLTGSSYAIYHSSADGTAGNEHDVINNLIYDFNSNGTAYALYNSGSDYVRYYHNTVSLDYAASTGGTTRGMYQTTTASGIEIKNNIFSITRGGSGAKTGIYLGSSGSTVDSDYNVIYLGGAGTGSLDVGYYSGAQTTSVDWQSANGGIYDNNSVFADPLLADPAGGDLTPLGSAANEVGANLGIADDFFLASRDATPDIGAIEFSPASANLGILMVAGLSDTVNCYSSSESFGFGVTNTVGTANFSTDNLSIHWTLTGPNAATGTITVTNDTLYGGDTATYYVSSPVDISNIGENTLNAYLVFGPDSFPTNDTLAEIQFGAPQLVVTNTNDANYAGQTVEVQAAHPLLVYPIGFSEIWQYTSAYSSSIMFPGYVDGGTSIDYIELTNFGSSSADLSGWTFERVGSSGLVYTFPSGASASAGGTIILATGSGTDNAANGYFYIGGAGDAVFSSTSVGYILRDGSGSVVDAVGVNSYSFDEASTGVSAADWSGSMPSASSQMAVYLNGLDDNTATNWAVSASGYQNSLTIGVGNGSSNASDPIVDWSNAVSMPGAATTITHTPATSGSYTYTASFTDGGGCVFTDSVTVVLGDTCPIVDSAWVHILTDTMVIIRWDTVPGAYAYKIALYNLSGGPNVIAFKHGQQGQKTLTGLQANTKYSLVIRAACGSGFSDPSNPVRFKTLAVECPVVTTFSASPVGSDRARINWTVPTGVQKVWVRWKQQSDTVWTDTIVRNNTKDRYWIVGLTPSTTYVWQIRGACDAVGNGAPWSGSQTFTTTSSKADFGAFDAAAIETRFDVFPNPSKGQFRVDIETLEAGARTMMLINSLGEVVHTERISVSVGEQSFAIDASNLGKGIYFLRVEGGAQPQMQRVVIE